MFFFVLHQLASNLTFVGPLGLPSGIHDLQESSSQTAWLLGRARASWRPDFCPPRFVGQRILFQSITSPGACHSNPTFCSKSRALLLNNTKKCHRRSRRSAQVRGPGECDEQGRGAPLPGGADPSVPGGEPLATPISGDAAQNGALQTVKGQW